MKNNFKNGILYIGVFYMAIVSIMMFKSYFNMVTTIELSENNEYVMDLKNYKERASNISNPTCKKYIDSLIDKVNKDINTKEINLKEYYESISNQEDNILSYYSEGIESCNEITIEKMKESDMPLKFITSAIQSDEMMRDYIYQYEIGFSDIKVRKNNEVSLQSVENNIKIQNELKIIDELLNMTDSGKEA